MADSCYAPAHQSLLTLDFTRGRSEAEKFSKLCIVIEETDETEFWLELIQEAELIETSKLQHITKEANELIKIFSTTRAKMKK